MDMTGETGEKFIVMHIPKCAGTTLRIALEEQYGRDSLALLYSRRDQFGRPHRSFVEYQQKFIIGHFGVDHFREGGHGRRVITFMRDPVDRVLSHYYYWRQIQERSMGPRLARCLPLKDFLSSDIVAVRRQISNLQAWMFISNIDMLSRHRLACVPQDELFDMAVENVSLFDFIGFTETLDKDLRLLNYRYGWGLPRVVRTLNRTAKRKRVVDLDAESHDMLRAVTRLDRRLFEYVRKRVYPRQFESVGEYEYS